MFSSARTGSPAATSPTKRQPGTAQRLLGLVDQELDRARLRRVAPQEADLLEVRQVRVHRGGGVEPDRLADLAHRRRVAGLRRVLADVVEDLLLALGQVHLWLSSSRCRATDGNTCS